jgi:glycosyltransferase involved in cell wall biosynthesis
MEIGNYIFPVPLGGFGGLEMQMAKRAKDIINKGGNSLLITLENSRLDKYANELGISTVYAKPKRKYFDLDLAKIIAYNSKKNNCNKCIVGTTALLSTAVLANKLYGAGLDIFLYQQMQSDIKKKDIVHNFIYRTIKGAITLTEKMRGELLKNTIIKSHKVKAIPYGIEIEKFNPNNHIKSECRAMFGLPTHKFIFGYIARIEDQKDQKTAIKAFGKANLDNALLCLAGTPATKEYLAELQQLITEHSLEDSVEILDFTPHVDKLMNAFDVFVMSSQSETFGLVNAEALASGLPVLATDSGGVPEIIKHNENGLLFTQKDYETLSQYMSLICRNEELIRKFSQSGLAYAKQHYDYETQTSKFLEFCESI